MLRLKRRQDFIAAAKAVSQGTPGFLLQGRKREEGENARVGFTCSKKLGNAVARNRIKRRLREAVRLSMQPLARPDFDYVLVGRPAASDLAFENLQKDLISAVARLHAKAAAVKVEVK
jgi:ribonuclease P protein component